MASLQVSSLISSSSSQKQAMLQAKAAIHVPNFPRAPKLPSLPTTNTLFQELNNGFTHSSSILPVLQDNNDSSNNVNCSCSSKSKATMHQLYAILEAVSDRVEMHHNVGEQRNNWNTLLLNSINMITLTATVMCGMAAASGAAAGAPVLALKLSSALLFSAATGMVVIMNKIQPSQLAEEQRNATRLFKQLEAEIETIIALGNPSKEDVKRSMKKVLALDKAYPLPLLGAMLEKFPQKFEPAVWWPSSKRRTIRFNEKKGEINNNGWDKGLEMEMREVVEVMKKKDVEDYERLGNLVLKINKTLAIAGPLLTGIAAVGSCFVRQGSWASVVPLVAGALATAVNAFEHGGQVGMVAEMYRSTAGFFRQTQDWIQETIEEEIEEREDGELFEMKLALKLGRSLSQLRDLAAKSAYSRIEGTPIDEFASKIF
ncbi:hypothetical protein HN51_002808 [Arachis hypogaea]|uniref:Probable F-box protein At4g22030 n=1 Tax=Arachis duranensis TaxID=130453 RepID=A0A6P4BLK4_ARADU|nr:probable F-box protein At4g22030 [Arachis duranensis]XP_025612694.1 probable F-box protein At4g22030 [Arachis hypogaea]QHO51044.1 putative F-box protein [Arachis hypogaea]